MDPKMRELIDLLPRDSELRELLVEPELARMQMPQPAPSAARPVAVMTVKPSAAALERTTKKNDVTAQAPKPAVATKKPAERASTPVVAARKEETTMAQAKKTMTVAESRDAFAKLARVTKDPNVRRFALDQVELCEDALDPSRAAIRAELDRAMGLTSSRVPVAFQAGARHGMRAIGADEARRELERRGVR